MDATFDYLDHDDIIQFMQALGYKSCEDGVCYGFAMTGLADILRKDWQRFNRRLQWMTLIKQVANQLSRSLDKFMVLSLMDVAMQAFPEEADIIAGIPAFCESIELHFQPEYYPEWFEAEKAPSAQSAEHTLSLLLPSVLQREMREKPGVNRNVINTVFSSGVFTGVYTLNELELYFKSLRKILKKNKTNIALLLSSASHSKLVSYDCETNQWIQLDIRTPEVETFHLCQSIAYEVRINFSENNYTSFATQIFGTDKAAIDKILLLWKEDVNWQRIHDLDFEKSQLLDSHGRKLIHVAAQNGDIETIRNILILAGEKGRAVINDLSEEDDKSPLQHAVSCSQRATVEFLLKNGAKPNSHRSLSSLQRAVKMKADDIVKLLLEYGANPDAVCRHGQTALDRAVRNGQAETVKILTNVNLFAKRKSDTNESSGVAKKIKLAR